MTTDEQIAEARKFLANPNLGKNMMRELDKAMIYIRRLADIAEAAEARVKELEAATRVPVNGEPNGDRTPEFEAIEQELFKHQPLLSMQDGSIRGCKCMDRVFVTKTEDWGTHLAEVFMRLSRATVPDAATAAIARVRAAKYEVDSIHQIHGADCLCGFSSVRSRSRTEHITEAMLAALDGAPEPDDDPCKAETHSWSHYRPEQIDSYWIRCTRLGKHDEHEDSNTGLEWRSGLPVEGESK